jgi:integrase
MPAKLTALKIEQIKPRSVRTEIPDAGQPGLYLVVQPSGSKSWAVRYRNTAGQQRKLTLDKFCSLETARKLTRKALDEIAEGGDPAAAKQIRIAAERAKLPDDDNTFGAAARRFINQYARGREKRLRSWQEVARLLGLRPDPEDEKQLLTIKGGLADRWGKRHISEITRRDVIALIDSTADKIIENGGSGIGANRSLAAIRKLFNWAISKDMIAVSPSSGVVRPVAEKSRDRKLSDDEIRWFWHACDTLSASSDDKRTGESVFGYAFKLLLLTGQRRREVGRMTEAELNLETRTWSLSKERTKNKREHVVPLSAIAIEIIKAIPHIKNPAAFLFCTNGKTAVSGWSRAKDQLDKLMLEVTRQEAKQRGEHHGEVNIVPWRIHDLRRTAATHMAKIGTPPHVIEAVLNHVSGVKAGVAGIYNQEQYPKEKRTALDGLARHLDAIVTGKTADVLSMDPPLRRQATLNIPPVKYA